MAEYKIKREWISRQADIATALGGFGDVELGALLRRGGSGPKLPVAIKRIRLNGEPLQRMHAAVVSPPKSSLSRSHCLSGC